MMLKNIDIRNLKNFSYNCSCGSIHKVNIEHIIIENNALDKIPEILKPFKKKKIFIVSDNNTFDICGRHIENMLAANSFTVSKYIFVTEHDLIPDDKSLGKLLMQVDEDTGILLAAGSGVVNDLTRYIAFKMKIPFIVAGTAPSMDGYASMVSPLITDNYKGTYKAACPYAVIGDIDILTKAPDIMLQAGFGDVLGKKNALLDWNLSRIVNKESYCPEIAGLVEQAVNICIKNVDGIKVRNKTAVEEIMKALVLAGVSMGLYGDSRPASGAEHHLAHFWDLDAIANKKDHPLHGNSVGVGTAVISRLYKKTSMVLPAGLELNCPKEIDTLLDKAGAHKSPKTLGIKKNVFLSSILEGHSVSVKYTILDYLNGNAKELLKKSAEEITEYYYG